MFTNTVEHRCKCSILHIEHDVMQREMLMMKPYSGNINGVYRHEAAWISLCVQILIKVVMIFTRIIF